MNELWLAAFTYAMGMILLTKAFTLMYQTVKAPNYSIGSIMTMGAYAVYIGVRNNWVHPLMGYPVAFITGASVSYILSRLVVEPLIRRERSPVLITIGLMALGLVLENLILAGSYLLRGSLLSYRTNIMLLEYDYNIGGIRGIHLISQIHVISTIFGVRHVYRNTGFGLGFRAFIENRELAQVQGINTDKIRVIIWTFAGGLAGLAGSIMVMRFHVTAMMGSYVMMAVIAATLLGGINSHRGAVIGGLLVGLSDILLVSWGQRIIGVWFGEYRFLTPFSIIGIVLCLNPNGLLGSDNPGYGRFNLRRVKWKRLLAIIVVLAVSSGVVFNTCNKNKAIARDKLFGELSEYERVVKEWDRDAPKFRLGNFTVFKEKLSELNNSTVYVTPYDDRTTDFTFYYERSNVYWRAHGFL